jgi:UDP-glucose:(heptosyl)LPS alpha-1,3-glucosyltransferase
VRVALLIDRFEPSRGGAERALAQLACHLVAGGHEVAAYCEESGRGVEDLGLRIHRLRVRRMSRGAKERVLGRRLVDEARAAGYEVLVGVRHLPEVDLYWPHGGSHLATLAARRSARHGNLESGAGRVPRGRHRTFVALEHALLQGGGARLVACPSRLVQEELTALYPGARDRLRLVPNGIDLERFHPRAREQSAMSLRRELGLDAHVPLLVMGARNPLLKGFRELLAALRVVGDPAWHLLVAGPRRLRPLRRLARAAGLADDRLSLRTHLDPLWLAAGADLALLPTWRDTCGLVVLEALAAGTPVITTRLAGAAEVLTDPEAGTAIEHPARDAELVQALGHWIERVRSGSVDRERVRAAVSERGSAPWMRGLEALLAQLAARSG